jgi:hypothetical protein
VVLDPRRGSNRTDDNHVILVGIDAECSNSVRLEKVRKQLKHDVTLGDSR